MSFLTLSITAMLFYQSVAGSPETVLSSDFQVHIVGADENGNPVVRRWVSEGADPERNLTDSMVYNGPKLDYSNHKMDYVLVDRNFSSSKASTRQASGPAIIEAVIVVDKDFGDLFSHNYQRIVDYLTVYFWDVNMRFKTLPSADISIRVNGLLIMESPQAQPFIENARASDGRTELGRILTLYKSWVYEQRGWLVKHDVAPLMTASRAEWFGGLAHAGGTCWVDDRLRMDYGTCVWNDVGDWGSIKTGTHELAHTIGAPHDDDQGASCGDVPWGFIMDTRLGGNRYFFSECSDRWMSKFVNSDSGACLKRIDGYSTTPMDPNFSSPKAPTMDDLCKKLLSSDSWIADEDIFECKELRCKRRDASNTVSTHYYLNSLVENAVCGRGTGRCFRGRCRPEGKLIRNQGDGTCIGTPDRFGHMIPAKMIRCPSSRDRTPLNSIEIRDGPGDKRLATPFTEAGNTESGDRCLYTGYRDGDAIWTDRCSDNTWQGWEFRSVGGANFLLVHKVTGRCAMPHNAGEGSWIQTFACDSGNTRMLWSLMDGY
ncbi:uncharacterized protein LOC118437124 [Folsomia candida]|uniref:uncharacterized protein LOC118437124 n=1 Tax=Folsomia candida TaxID=158441 RepID=UPI0016052E76|nr:uncharacterized protein LOC118437124 [Folsomia candida]